MTIPYLARAITSTTFLPTRLKGLLIGNGWFSPQAQYPAYVSYGRGRGFMKKNSKEVAKVNQLWKACNSTLQSSAGDHVLVGICEDLIEAVVSAGQKACVTIHAFERQYLLTMYMTPSNEGTPGCLGAYDVRPRLQNCGEYPAGLKYTTPYLQVNPVFFPPSLYPD